MNIPKAIKKLHHLTDPSYFLISTDEREAIELGIEALKHCRNFRDNSLTWGYKLLPGETKE